MFYEVALIPMYLLIGVWGTGRKEYSAMKLTLMLMGGSAFLMLGLLGIYWHGTPEGMTNTWNILEISHNGCIDHGWQNLLFCFTFVGFGVLGAMFPFHTWSPDGHACAPTAVSMLHAGVLMKLGGYGCFRIAIFLLPAAAQELAWIFIILTGISIVYGAFSACVQTDLKYINAYSSVSHCGMVLFAILMLNSTAMTGGILQMLSHGLMTALFFALIGMIYGRTHTRDIREMGGIRSRDDHLLRIVRTRRLLPSFLRDPGNYLYRHNRGLYSSRCRKACARSRSERASSHTHRRQLVGAPLDSDAYRMPCRYRFLP